LRLFSNKFKPEKPVALASTQSMPRDFWQVPGASESWNPEPKSERREQHQQQQDRDGFGFSF